MSDKALQEAVQKVERQDDSEEGLWLFGYGSLIWKPPPHFDQRVPGYIKGYVRRFWQQSIDHRGTPSFPGLVVTLLERSYWETLDDPDSPTTTSQVWGTAYHIPHTFIAAVMTYLDIRENNGYSIHYTDFYPSPSSSSSSSSLIPQILLYIATPSNPQYFGPQSPQIAADIISRSAGLSGTSAEYLFRLEDALAHLGPQAVDMHISGLVERVKGRGCGGEIEDGRKGRVEDEVERRSDETGEEEGEGKEKREN